MLRYCTSHQQFLVMKRLFVSDVWVLQATESHVLLINHTRKTKVGLIRNPHIAEHVFVELDQRESFECEIQTFRFVSGAFRFKELNLVWVELYLLSNCTSQRCFGYLKLLCGAEK